MSRPLLHLLVFSLNNRPDNPVTTSLPKSTTATSPTTSRPDSGLEIPNRHDPTMSIAVGTAIQSSSLALLLLSLVVASCTTHATLFTVTDVCLPVLMDWDASSRLMYVLCEFDTHPSLLVWSQWLFACLARASRWKHRELCVGRTGSDLNPNRNGEIIEGKAAQSSVSLVSVKLKLATCTFSAYIMRIKSC